MGLHWWQWALIIAYVLGLCGAVIEQCVYEHRQGWKRKEDNAWR